MELLGYLKTNEADLVAEATAGVACARLPHYDEGGEGQIRERLRRLLEQVIASVDRRSLQPIVEHAEAIAGERFAAGFDLFEVQVAFNSLEEVIWRRLLKDWPPAELGQGLGPIATVLGAGKDALARRYVSLATQKHHTPLDMRALFSGLCGG